MGLESCVNMRIINMVDGLKWCNGTSYVVLHVVLDTVKVVVNAIHES